MNPKRITDMASAFYESSVLFAASDLGVFATLAAQPGASAGRVGELCGLNGRGVTLLLDACVALGLLRKDGTVYHNSPEAAAFLVPGTPGDLSRAIRYNRDVYAAWGKLPEMIRTGRPVESPQLHLGDDPERTRAFVLAMHGRAQAIGRMAIPHFDLTGCRNLLDVGGGPGTFSAMLARTYPELHCDVLDLPAVVRIAAELLRGQGLDDRVRTLSGDYHVTPFPPGQDVVLFSGMLHQESPGSIQDLLVRAHAALVPGGRVIVLDMMTDASHTQPAFSALFAVNMALTTTCGWVFADAELRAWLEDAGFVDFTCKPLPPPLPHWLATARRQA